MICVSTIVSCPRFFPDTMIIVMSLKGCVIMITAMIFLTFGKTFCFQGGKYISISRKDFITDMVAFTKAEWKEASKMNGLWQIKNSQMGGMGELTTETAFQLYYQLKAYFQTLGFIWCCFRPFLLVHGIQYLKAPRCY